MEQTNKVLADFIKEYGNLIIASKMNLEYKKTLNK